MHAGPEGIDRGTAQEIRALLDSGTVETGPRQGFAPLQAFAQVPVARVPLTQIPLAQVPLAHVTPDIGFAPFRSSGRNILPEIALAFHQTLIARTILVRTHGVETIAKLVAHGLGVLAAEAIRHGGVAVRHVAAMRGIVDPDIVGDVDIG